ILPICSKHPNKYVADMWQTCSRYVVNMYVNASHTTFQATIRATIKLGDGKAATQPSNLEVENQHQSIKLELHQHFRGCVRP
ncbi:unnamed protein product, partial [Citrullus colocynthis]